MSKEQFTAEVKRIFDAIDTDHNGFISTQEFHTAISTLPHTVDAKEEQSMLAKLDSNHDQQVSFEEFSAFITKRFTKINNLFKQVDTNGDGKIDANELKVVLQKLDPLITDDIVAQIMKKYDKNGDGNINWDEWRDMVLFIPHIKNMERLFQFWKNTVALTNLIHDDTPIPLIKEEATTSKKSDYLFLKSFVAGGVSGILSRTGVAPLERVKMIQQVSTSSEPTTVKHLLKQIYQQEGIKGLFRGNFINVLKSAPQKSINFACFEQFKSWIAKMNPKQENLNSGQFFIAASASGAVSHIILHPMEVIRTHISVNPSIKSVSSCFQHLLHEQQGKPLWNKITPFFRGLGTSLIGTIPNTGFNLMSYELMKQFFFSTWQPKDESQMVIPLMLIGASSAAVSQFVFYPFHVLKSKLIVQQTPSTTLQSRNSASQLVKEIWSKQGWKGFYKGFQVSLIKSVPAHAISFGTYEAAKVALGLNNHTSHK